MKAVKSEGSSIEDAIDRALILLGLPREETDFEVLRDPAADPGESALVRVWPRGTGAETASEPPGGESSEQRPPQAARQKPSPPEEVAEEAAHDESPRREVQGLEAEPRDVSGETSLEGRGQPRSVREQEDRAVEFLDHLLELLDADCVVGVLPATSDGRITLELTGPDTGLMIGRKAQTLDAVEFLLNRALDHEAPGGPRVSLDAEGYRSRREAKLRGMAREQADEVRRSGEGIELEPMSARDRRTIHMALRDDDGVETHSEGEGLDRRVVIEPSDW